MKRNVDCGLCTECFKSCPYDNVSLVWRRGPWNDRFSSYGEVWQATVLLVLALAYALTIHSPWPAIRDIVNMVDKANWVTFGLYAMVVWGLALGVIPFFFWLTTALGLRLAQGGEGTDNPTDKKPGLLRKQVFTREVGQALMATMPCIIPLGITLWASFFAATIMVNFTFVLMTLSDPLGWGWNLLGIAGMPWIQIWPSGIPWIQTALVLAGLTMTLKKGHELWSDFVGEEEKALKAFVPTAVILVALAVGMLVYFTNY